MTLARLYSKQPGADTDVIKWLERAAELGNRDLLGMSKVKGLSNDQTSPNAGMIRLPPSSNQMLCYSKPSCGLLRASFHPERDIAVLRSYMRLRERHLDYAVAHIQYMQKALTHMNLQLQHVVSDITGATGSAIVAGERNATMLAMRDLRCQSTTSQSMCLP